MKIHKSPRYTLVTKIAIETARFLGIDSYPIDLKKIIKAEGIKLKSYSSLAKKLNISVEEVCASLKSELGLLVRHESGQYTLNYNDTQLDYLITFTLAHELGHYTLGHLEDFEVTELNYRGMSDKEYKVLENEANCFARNLLSPAPVASLFKEKNIPDLMNFFGIGFGAAKTRLDFLGIDIHNTQIILTDETKVFFRKIRYDTSNRYHCESCGAITLEENAKYCTICGHNNLIHITPDGYSFHKDFGGEIMKYKEFELDENGYALRCPICGNEEFIEHARICHICGNLRRNVCLGYISDYLFNDSPKMHACHFEESGCGTVLRGNSRYCHKCAGVSSFYYQNMLESWEVERERKSNDLPF